MLVLSTVNEGTNFFQNLGTEVLAGLIIAGISCLMNFVYKRVKCNVNKGFFEIAYRNICANYWDKSMGPINEFDLNKPIPFRNKGNDKITLDKYKIIVNKNVTVKRNVREIYQTGENLSTKSINLNLNEVDKTNQQLNVKIFFDIKNTDGYKYTQILNLKFIKDKNFNIWHLIEMDNNFKIKLCYLRK